LRACLDRDLSSAEADPDSTSRHPSEKANEDSSKADGRRLLAVSHPAVVSVNQETYLELIGRGWDVTVVVPARWRGEYSPVPAEPQVLDGMRGSMHPIPVLMPGRPQRHLYMARCAALIRRLRPQVAFLEAESYSLAASQWSFALHRLGVPFGVQCAENIDRGLPAPVHLMRSLVLREAAFVAARSDSAALLARAWGARGEVELVPHAVPAWEHVPTSAVERPFTVGYAGRLVESKGLFDLLEAVRALESPVELLLIGEGELRSQLEGQPIPGSQVRVIDDLSHAEMASGYAQLDVLVLPSHTTPTWKEQFGRVIVEALWCGVPVVGSDSGEIPWLIELTGGGLVFPEGESTVLADRLVKLRERPELRQQLARTGRAAVERLFTVPAATDPLEQMLLHAAERASTSPAR
jgi:glycosyltransferase involved in cell wall biosynthesis